MKKTKSAIRYGMETLKVSPDVLFKIIESSKGYDGEDYSRWLAGKIIEVAENDGVQFSQLLVKKFNIVNEILEEVSDSQDVREEFINIFKSLLHKDTYSVNFDNIGTPLDVDWYSGLDLDEENSFFVREKLPSELQEKLLNNEEVSLLFKLSLDSADKKSDLYSDAKGHGVGIQSKGALMLYRLASMARAFDISNTSVGLYVPVKFLSDEENKDVIDFMLSYYKIEKGFCINSVEMSLSSLNAGDIAFMLLKPIQFSDECQDGVKLTSLSLDTNSVQGYKEGITKRYSRSSSSMIDYIVSNYENSMSVADLSVPMLDIEGNVVGMSLEDPTAEGYLNINGDYAFTNLSLSSFPVKGFKNIPINKDNILDIIAYYGITVSKAVKWGYSRNIGCLVDGKVGFEELLYNCIPLFLYDIDVYFGNVVHEGEEYKSGIHLKEGGIISDILEIGLPYFSFEAKELFNLCNDLVTKYEKETGDTGKSFKYIRKYYNNENYNELYDRALSRLKEYVDNLSNNFI